MYTNINSIYDYHIFITSENIAEKDINRVFNSLAFFTDFKEKLELIQKNATNSSFIINQQFTKIFQRKFDQKIKISKLINSILSKDVKMRLT
jgi:hypothetical protein